MCVYNFFCFKKAAWNCFEIPSISCYPSPVCPKHSFLCYRRRHSHLALKSAPAQCQGKNWSKTILLFLHPQKRMQSRAGIRIHRYFSPLSNWGKIFVIVEVRLGRGDFLVLESKTSPKFLREKGRGRDEKQLPPSHIFWEKKKFDPKQV